MSIPPLLAIAVQYYYQERQLPPWNQDELFQIAAKMELSSPEKVARTFFELFIPFAERQRGGSDLETQIMRDTTPLFSPLDYPFGEQNFYSLTYKEQLYYTQSSDEDEMLARMAAFREKEDEYLREVSDERRLKSPWVNYTTDTLLSGHSIFLCSKEQLLKPLVEGDQVYPFDRGDLFHLMKNKTNPFTGKTLPLSYQQYLRGEKNDWRQTLVFYSLDDVLRGLFKLQPWCPMRLTYPYYGSVSPLKSNAPFPGPNLDLDIRTYNAVPWYPYYTYQNEEDTGRAQLLLDPYRKPYSTIQERYLTDKSILKALSDFHDPATSGFRQIPRDLWPRLEVLHFKSSQPIRVYRGLSGIKIPSHIGDSFDLSSNKVQSWTTSFCVAQNYATIQHNKGVVVSTILKPSDILIDSRYIATKQLEGTVKIMRNWSSYLPIPRNIIFLPAQIEILSKPGTYNVTVANIVRNEPETRIYPMKYKYLRSDLLTDTYPVT